MEYGQAKWIIHPLGVKVRVGKGPFSEHDFDLEIDYAGSAHLGKRLEDMGYIDTEGNDLVPYQLEPLDSDWKSKLLDFMHDLYGPEPLTCEIHSLECVEAVETFGKAEADQWCLSHGKGKSIPLFMAEFLEEFEWFESHLKIRGDGRGRNPNSLKNLKQFKVDIEKVKE